MYYKSNGQIKRIDIKRLGFEILSGIGFCWFSVDSPPGGGTRIIFWRGCAARPPKPLPISKDFSRSKKGWFECFFENFENWDPFLRVFCLKNGWFDKICRKFWKLGPISKDFWAKWDPCLRISAGKTNPFGRHIPSIPSTCEYPPGTSADTGTREWLL